MGLLAAALAAVGSICAYLAYKKQHVRLLAAQDAAQKAQRLAEMEMQRKSDLITYLAHDLRTPLASVVAYLSLLVESPELASEQRARYSGIALDKALRLEQLIGELFDVIRFNLQAIRIQREDIRLKLMLMQLADEFYPILLPEGKRITIDCADEIVLKGDSDKLARVFNNILKNAAAYSYANSEISIHVRRADKYLYLRFTNLGEPIPEEKRQLIFEKFYRLDGARSTSTGGAGLGLAIAREIITAHGGTIEVESEKSGTSFVVALPYEA